MSGRACTVTRTIKHYPGDPLMQFEHVYALATVRDLYDAATLAGVLPSELIGQVWLQRAALVPAG